MLGALGDSPWVDRHLAENWRSIAASVPPELLPRLRQRAPRQRKLVAEEYGCGAFGCVMPTSEPGVVVKITTDQSEAWFASAAMALAARDGWPAGMVQYSRLLTLPGTHRKRPLYLLWRQEAIGIGYLTRPSRDNVSVLHNLRFFREYARYAFVRIRHSKNPRAVVEQVEREARGGDVYEIVSESVWFEGDRVETGLAPRFAPTAVLVRACEVIAEYMQNTYQQDALGTALGYYTEHGLLLSDVHAGNVGMAVHPEYESPIPSITDPGMACPVKSTWFDFQIGGALPPGI